MVFLCQLGYGALAQYTGTGSVSQGPGTTLIPDLYSCGGGRVPPVGTVTASDGSSWEVPAAVRFNDTAFPFASDLYNSCNGATYAQTSIALAALNGSDVVEIDPGGELITGFLFADNYFELYVNGVPVGKDKVPYTPFNSSIVRFRVNRPFTIAMLLVDWEEHPGMGTEANNGFTHHAGDGGLVAFFRDASDAAVDLTGPDWKAQTFYTAPILDLACPSESGSLRLSDACPIQDSNNGNSDYALHWERPSACFDPSFDDSDWPAASIYSNATVGVAGKPAYENFPDVFDDPTHDAVFIWSSNLVLDNEVVVRHTVPSATGLQSEPEGMGKILVYPNPAHASTTVRLLNFTAGSGSTRFRILDGYGRCIVDREGLPASMDLDHLTPGIYMVQVVAANRTATSRFVVE